MKIAEALSKVHQQEGKLHRILDLRDALVRKEFEHRKADDLSQEEYNKQSEDFFKEKISKINDLNAQADALRNDMVAIKNAINTINVSHGMDRHLAEIGLLRLELSKLMKLSTDRYALLSRGSTMDTMEETGILKRISELETRKAQLDAKVQSFNWKEDIVDP